MSPSHISRFLTACSLKWTALMEHFTGVLRHSVPLALLPIHTFTVMATAAVQGATCSSLFDCSQTPCIHAGPGTVISHGIFGAQHRIHLIYSALMSKNNLFLTRGIRFKLYFHCILHDGKKETNDECNYAGFRKCKTDFWFAWSAMRCLIIFSIETLHIQSCSPL